jgi:phosphoglycolate phosphatase
MFPNVQAIAFDLDGTLVDTSEVVLAAFHAVFETLQREGKVQGIPDDSTFLGTFGVVDEQIWEMLLPDATEEVRREADTMHERYLQDHLPGGVKILPGALETLEALQGRFVLATASNCGIPYLNTILACQGLGTFFSHRFCAGTIQAKEKAEVLEEILKRLGHRNLLMVGDRKSDVDAARRVGIPVVGVRYKFAKADELREADFVLDQIGELPKLLKK